MKILHFNQSDIIGGAAIAAYRLHKGLLNQNIDSRVIVGTKTMNNDRIIASPRQVRLENQLSRINSVLGLNYLNIISSFNLTKNPVYQEADILHFHNLHGGYFNYLAIPKLTKNKPAIFTLHDMWSFTGHCSYSYDCNKWKTGCGNCPYPDTPPRISRDNTAIEWKLKNWVYDNSNLTIVTDSKWLAEEAKKSILKRFPIYHIPYSLDTEIYQPLDVEKSRYALNIPLQDKVFIFGAERLQDYRKGGDLLIKVLSTLPDSLKQETTLLTIGNGGDKISQLCGIKTINLGYINNDRLKSLAYSAADLFLFPTRADAFGLVALESASCGTPTVAFNVGGVSDIVRHHQTGYLAKPEDIDDFKQGILELLENKDLLTQIKQKCREITINEYSLEIQANRYIELYKNLVKQK